MINERYKVRKNKRKPGEVRQGQMIKGLNPHHSSVRQPWLIISSSYLRLWNLHDCSVTG